MDTILERTTVSIDCSPRKLVFSQTPQQDVCSKISPAAPENLFQPLWLRSLAWLLILVCDKYLSSIKNFLCNVYKRRKELLD